MTQGMIQGGWEYIWAAYGVSWLMIAGYIFLTYWRGRNGS